jgi:hypothetical protein
MHRLKAVRVDTIRIKRKEFLVNLKAMNRGMVI